MSLNVAIAMVIGCVLGVFSTIIIVGMAFAVKERQMNDYEPEQNEQEDKHE